MGRQPLLKRQRRHGLAFMFAPRSGGGFQPVQEGWSVSVPSPKSPSLSTLKQDAELRMDLPLRNSRIKLPLGQVFWREVGQGPVLMFLHGSLNDGSQWLPVIDRLSQKYQCFALDLLGFGDSEHPNIHYSIQLEVECLLQYIEALHLSQVYLIGHSLGGWIAARFALNHSEDVGISGLVLIEPEGVQAQGKPLDGGWKRWLIGRPSMAYLLVRFFYPLAKLFGLHKPIKQALEWRKHMLSSPTACKLLYRRRRAEIKGELLQEQLEWLKVPTLILQGEQDTPDAIARSQIYASGILQAHLQVVEQGGHNLPETLPDLVAQQIDSFIRTRT
jgi:pimeloyl-ACP methyl ester carboxylesterase